MGGVAATAASASTAVCAAVISVTLIQPELPPADLICAAVVGGLAASGEIAIGATAGGCFDCTMAKPCSKDDAVARGHGCLCSPSSTTFFSPLHQLRG